MRDTRKRYEIICPYCGKVQYACKSIAQEEGIADWGSGTCLGCKGSMHLIFNEDAQSMRAEKWEDASGERPESEG